MNNELIIVEKMELVPFFTKGEQVEDLLAQIEKEVLAFVPDVTSNKGRSAIKAMVTKVTKSKTYLEKQGKTLKDEYIAIPKAIDANRRLVKDKLTALAEQVRAPLTEYEEEALALAVEKKRIAEAEEQAAKVEQDHEFGLLLNVQFDADIAAKVAALKAEHEARQAQFKADQEAREKQIAEEAAAKSKADAEEATQRAIQAEEFARLQAVQNELNRKAAELQTIADAEQAETKRIEAAKQARIDADNAAEQARLNEVARVQAEEKLLADEQAKREANKANIGRVRKAAKESIMAVGIDEATAKKLVLAIHNNDIANVSISY